MCTDGSETSRVQMTWLSEWIVRRPVEHEGIHAGRRFRDLSKHGYNSFFREVCSDGVVVQPPNCFIKQIRTRPLVVYHLNVNAHCVDMQLRYERSQSRLFPLPSRMINTSWYVNFISSFVKELTASGTGASMLSGWCLLLLLVLLKRLGLV